MKTRKVFCNRTLNLRSIKAIGYDMDYTLIHYHAEKWENQAYQRLKKVLLDRGWPVSDLEFEPERVCRGLIIDRETGNLVKANRFGFVKRAIHGSKVLDYDEQREKYSRTIVDLADPRWVFLNTLFSLSEGCIFSQLVDLLDQRKIPEVLGYADLYERVRTVLDHAHMEGHLKDVIIRNPEAYVDLDPDMPLALLDQKESGKTLMLITNSEWSYTVPMMKFAVDKYLPKSMTWKDLFDVIIVSARKPAFFTTSSPFFEVVTPEGLLKPKVGPIEKGKSYLGGYAQAVEKHLKLEGDEILYVGDHMFGDVHVSKNFLRWRTALIIRELESELESLESFRAQEDKLAVKMIEKEKLESKYFQARIKLQRKKAHGKSEGKEYDGLLEEQNGLRDQLEKLDQTIAPLAQASAQLSNKHWGLLMRAGNDKSYLAYQLERYADIYTSRVSNFLDVTPFGYLRSPRGSLPHDL